MAKRRPRKRFTRRDPEREPYDRVLIVCEGECTEPLYFEDLTDHYRLCTANIKVHAVRALADAKATADFNPSTEVHELIDYMQSLKSGD